MQSFEQKTEFPTFLKNPDPRIYQSSNYVVLDFETDNYSKGSPYDKRNSIVLSVWYVGSSHQKRSEYGTEPRVRWGSEYELGDLVDDCHSADYIIAHNAKFELGWLARCGVDLTKVIPFDTQIAEYVIAGNRNHWGLSLEACMQRRGMDGKENVVSKMIKDGVSPRDIPASWLQEYCIVDVKRTLQLFQDQRRQLFHDGLAAVFFTRCIFTPVLADIERHGMHLDKERVLAVYHNYNEHLQRLWTEFEHFTGGVNVNSPKQMEDFIYNQLKFDPPRDYKKRIITTGSGQIATGMDALKKLKPKNKKQREFLDLRFEIAKYKDAVTKYLKKMKDCVEETEDHILTAALNQTVTQTHRLSSSGRNYKMQFQNFQREFKPFFSARYPGWLMGELDEAQLEYRIAVDLARDEAGMRSIEEEVDRHSITASIIFKEEWEACGGDKKSAQGKKARTASKPHTFKPLYGGTSGTPREREYYKTFLEEHQQIKKMQEEWINTVVNTKQLRTASGLIFYWPDTRVTGTGYITNTSSICNYPVQMFATADIVPIAVTYMWHYIKSYDLQSFIVNTIHDSIISEIHPNEQEIFVELGDKALTTDVKDYLKKVYDYDVVVPLEAEVELGTHWAEPDGWVDEFINREVA